MCVDICTVSVSMLCAFIEMFMKLCCARAVIFFISYKYVLDMYNIL